MIRVEQTKLTYPDGNCFAACIASIFELTLDEVPDYMGDDWHEWWNRWLAERNLTLIHWKIPDPDDPDSYRPPGYSLLGADSPRGDWLHSVVCLDGEVVWDPHPQREMGLGTWRDWTVFAVLDPTKPLRVG